MEDRWPACYDCPSTWRILWQWCHLGISALAAATTFGIGILKTQTMPPSICVTIAGVSHSSTFYRSNSILDIHSIHITPFLHQGSCRTLPHPQHYFCCIIFGIHFARGSYQTVNEFDRYTNGLCWCFILCGLLEYWESSYSEKSKWPNILCSVSLRPNRQCFHICCNTPPCLSLSGRVRCTCYSNEKSSSFTCLHFRN